MTQPASPSGCEVWLRRPRSDEAGALAAMIAPLLDRDSDELEAALRAGPVQAARDLPMSEATQLAEVLMGFGAAAEVRTARAPDDRQPPVLTRGTRPFDASALRASLTERGLDEPRSLPPLRDTLPTPPVPSQPPVSARRPSEDRRSHPPVAQVSEDPSGRGQIVQRPQRAARGASDSERSGEGRSASQASSAAEAARSQEPSTPAVASRPPPFEPVRPAPPSWPEVTGEPTQVAPLDDDLIRAAIAAAEAAESAERRTPGQLAGRRSLPPSVEPPRASLPGAPISPRPSQPGTEPREVRSLPPRASRPPPPASVPAAPRAEASAEPPKPETRRADPPAAVLTTAENAALKGRVTLPKSMQSRDDLPPWFPKVPIRPEATAPTRSRLPIILFVMGVVALVAAVLFVVLQG